MSTQTLVSKRKSLSGDIVNDKNLIDKALNPKSMKI